MIQESANDYLFIAMCSVLAVLCYQWPVEGGVLTVLVLGVVGMYVA